MRNLAAMFNLLSLMIALVVLVMTIVGLIPLLGWLNWITIVVGIVGAVIGELSGNKTGRNVNILLLVVCAVRLVLGGGLL